MKSEKLKTEEIRALEWYAAMGVDSGIAPLGAMQTKIREHKEAKSHESSPTLPTMKLALSHPELDSGSHKIPDQARGTLSTLRQAVLDFEGCSLKATATNTVFADGVSTSKIMLIGEAPGATEDAKGIPFCGESGKLLDNMIASIGLTREKNVYITNTIFWRPPGNRAPTDQEIEACRPFVEQHIALINPDLLILVGSTAVTSLLGKHLQISRIRQEYYQYTNKYLDKSITTTALFHPAYLLRQPMQKKTTWYDLLKIKEFIGKNIKETVF